MKENRRVAGERVGGVHASSYIVVSSLLHTVWPIPSVMSANWVEEILLVEIRRVDGERDDWWRPRRLMLHGTLYICCMSYLSLFVHRVAKFCL